MTTLRYRSNVCVSELAVGECTMHRAADSSGARWWLLWFRVNRDSDGLPDDFAVPVNPNGPYLDPGPGGRTWGLNRVDRELQPGAWQVSPSIDVKNTRAVHAGEAVAPMIVPAPTSLWHQTPTIIEVPDGEAWISGAP